MRPRNVSIAFLVATAFILLPAIESHAQIFTTLATLSPAGINTPYGNLTINGSNIYGYAGGLGSYGLIYSIPMGGGSLTELVSFEGQPYGNGPASSVTISGATMYGATTSGGPAEYGTVFSAPLAGGTETNMFTFSGSNGVNPQGGLTLSGSTLYGSTYGGYGYNVGTIYSIPVSGGSATTLLTFSGTSGAYPGNSPVGNLVLSGSTLYGVTAIGGAYNDGTVFRMPITGGTMTSLFSFSGSNGANPEGGLTLSGSTLYGTTLNGGANNDGTVFSIPVTGGSLNTLLSFTGSNGTSLGANPMGTVGVSGSYVYGETSRGGASNVGTVFRVPVTGGTATTLVAFNIANGSVPNGGVTFSGQTLFGTTDIGGSNNAGVIFSLNVAPATIMLSGLASATIISGGSASFASTLSNASSAGYSLNYTLSSAVTSGAANLSAIAPNSGSLSPGGSRSVTFSASSSTLGSNVVSITASDPNSSTGSLAESASLTVLGHSAPNLAVSNNNQVMIVGATGVTASLSLSNGTSAESGRAALDVNSLGVGVSGGTGGKLVASGSTQAYTGTINSGTLGTQHAVFSINVGDDHTLSGASSPLNVSTTATWTVLGHAVPSLAVASGNDQIVVVGATGITAGLNLSNGSASQTGLAALDVNSLGSSVSGSIGDKLVASGSAQSYTASLSTGTLGLQTETFSVNAGDDHTLPGASPDANDTTSVTLTVLDHSNASLSSSSTMTSRMIAFGNVLQGAVVPSQSFTIYNRAANISAFYTSNLKLTGFTSSGDAAMTTNLAAFNGLTAGNGNTFTASLDTTNDTTTGIKTITLLGAQLVDDNTFSGAGNNNNGGLTVTLIGTVGSATADASNSPTTFGPALTAQVASSGSYANLASTVTSTTGSGGGGAEGTTATILSGTNASGSAQTVSMQWRTHSSSDPGLASDILDLSGMSFGGSGQADTFVLQMSYDAFHFGDSEQEAILAADEQISLDWLDPSTGQWENAIDGNFGTNQGTFHLGAWQAGDMTLGDWGVDTANDTVWAVVNHNSEFAVVPEPGTLALMTAGAVALIIISKRRSIPFTDADLNVFRWSVRARRAAPRIAAQVGAALYLASGQATFAATWTWTGGGSTYNWSTSANWSPASTPANNGTANLVMTGVTGVANTADTAWNINSLTFHGEGTAFAISGSQLTLGAGGVSVFGSDYETINNPVALSANQSWYTGSQVDESGVGVKGNLSLNGYTLTATGSGQLGLNGTISGSGSLVVSGSGSLVLALFGTNTFTGGTVVNNGEVYVVSDFGLGAAGAPVTLNAGTLYLNSTLPTATINRTITVGSGGGQITSSLPQGYIAAFPGIIQGPGSLTVDGESGNYFQLTGQNSYAGGTIVENTTLVGTTTSLQGNISMTNFYATLEFLQSSNGTYSGSISGGGLVEVSSSGVVTFTGSNTYTGGTEIYQGVLQVYGSGSALPLSGGLDFGGEGGGGGVIQFIGPTTYTGSASWSGSGGFSARNGKLTVNLGGAGATFNMQPALYPLVFGSSTASAPTEFQNPINLGSGQTSPAPTIVVNQGTGGDYAILSGQISGSDWLLKTGNGMLSLTASNTFTGELFLDGGAIQADDGVGLPSACTLQIDGGVLLSNGNATFTRPLGTGGGQVNWTGSGGFAAAGGTLTVNLGGSGATLSWGAGNFVPGGSALMLGAAWAGGETIFQNGLNLGSSTREIRVDSGLGGDFAVITGPIIGSGGLNKTGSGTLVLAASNGYSGGTSLVAGTLVVSNTIGSATGSGNVSLMGGTLASGTQGSISGTVTASSGSNMISPGGNGTIGTLGVGGLVLNNLTTLAFDIASTASLDQINDAGALSFSGSGAAPLLVTAGSLHNGAYKLIGFSSLSGIGSNTFTLEALGGGGVPGSYSTQLTSSALNLVVNYSNPAYTLSALPANSTLIAGGSTALTLTLDNIGGSGTPDSINFARLTAIATGSGSISGLAASGTLAPSATASNTGLSFSSNTAGIYTITPTATVSGVYGATPNLSASNSGTVTVLGHSLPNLIVTSGSNQTVIVGATGVTAGLTLSNGSASQGGLASLDVDSLGTGVSGGTGGKFVTSGSSKAYTAALSTGTLGTQYQIFSLDAGDDHTLPGALAPTNISTTASLTVFDHSNASLSPAAAQATQTINFGSVLLGANVPNQSFTIYNLAANTSAGYTANLKLTGFSTNGDSALTTNLATFGGLTAASGSNGNTFAASLNTANYTTTGIDTITMSATQLADDSMLPGAGNNNNGALTVTLVGNVGNAAADASNSPGTFGPALTAQVASSGSYANLASTVTSTTGNGGGTAEGTTATILAGSNATGSAQTVSMQWRTRNSGSEAGFASDILDLSGMSFNGSGQADPFVLEMSYDAGQFGDAADQALAAADGQISLDWLNPASGQWENAIDGDFGTNLGTFHLGAWQPGDMTLGDWGVDTANDTVWAVLNHNSTFAVVPEPSTLALLAAAAIGLAGTRLAASKLSRSG